MERLNDAITWYQHKIGTYDKQLWERSVEEKVIKSIQHVPKKSAKVKSELIDVDLVRGSTFTKAKPQHGWLAVSRTGLLRVLFLPLYFDWWKKQTCLLFSLLLLKLYILQLGVLVIYNLDTGQNVNSELMSLAHLVTPLVLIVSLGILHAQVVATQLSHRQKRKLSTKRPQSKHHPRKKKSRLKYQDKGSTNGSESGSHQKTLLSFCGVRQRRGKNMYARQASDSSSGDKQDNTRATRSDHERIYNVGNEEDNCEEEQFRSEKRMADAVDDSPTSNSAQTLLTIDESHRKNKTRSSIEIRNIPSSDMHATNVTLKTAEDDDDYDDDIILKTPKDQTVSYVSLDGETTTGNSGEFCQDIDQGIEIAGEIVLPNGGTNSFELTPNLVVSCSQDAAIKTEGVCIVKTAAEAIGGANGNDNHIHEKQKDNDIHYRDDLGEGFKPAGQIYIPQSDQEQEKGCPPVNCQGGGERLNRDRPHPQGSKVSRATQKSTQRQKLQGRKKQDQSLAVPSQRLQGRKQDQSLAVPPQSLTVGFSTETPSNGGTSCESEGESTPISPAPSKACRVHLSGNVARGPVLDGQSSDGQTSELDWEESMNTEVTSSSDSSSESSASPELTDDNGCNEDSDLRVHNVSSVLNNLASSNDKVSCMIWEENEVKKVDLNVLDIGWMIIKKVDKYPENSDSVFTGLVLSILGMILPLAFRVYHGIESLGRLEGVTFGNALNATLTVIGGNWREQAIVLNGVFQRLCLGLIFFFLLSVAERTFKQRLQYAKHFCYLTSSRRARKYELPHFRLNKVRNIKTWLSLRSYLKKRGPQRSVDCIVSASFFLAVMLVSIMCIELLQDSGGFLDHLGNWELVLWGMALGLYLLRFITLGTSINRKYRNFSVLITEQINLYLHMEQKPHKKDELMLANNVLKLAEELLKELESPFKVSGLSANPFLYNITKVIILSAFSAVLTELLGFKLKLYKIKLRA